MTNAFTRAGLFTGLALFFGPLVVWAEEPVSEAGFYAKDALAAARMKLLAGRGDEVRSGIEAQQAKERGESDCVKLPLELAIGWQNLEMQLQEVDPLGNSLHPDCNPMAMSRHAENPGDADYLQVRGWTPPPASGVFAALLIKHPGHRALRRAAAIDMADEGNWDDARKQFEFLVAEQPDDCETRHRFAFAAYYHKDLDLALEQWGTALAANPEHADSWYGLGVAWLGRGLFESAEKALRKAVEFDPIHWRAREALIQALTGQAKFEEVKSMRDLLRARAPRLPRVGDRITVAVIPREGGATVVREALLDTVPWRFRIELFDQATPGKKPIKVMELRRDKEGFAWGLAGDDGVFHPVKTLAALPDLKQVLEEAK